jgi:hypothetical protein
LGSVALAIAEYGHSSQRDAEEGANLAWSLMYFLSLSIGRNNDPHA